MLTEQIFETRDDAEALMASFAEPEVRALVIADEEKFIEPGSANKRMFVVEFNQTKIT